jgi:pimeloyl-ACP methyl ester carboxylesterase
MREKMSGWPPGVNGTMMRIGRLGNSAAASALFAPCAAGTAQATLAAAQRMVLTGELLILISSSRDVFSRVWLEQLLIAILRTPTYDRDPRPRSTTHNPQSTTHGFFEETMPTAPVRNGEIYYEESGSGELIVLIAGLGHGAAYFEKTLPLLAKFGRAVAIDTRGVGRSTSRAERFSVESWAADAVELLDHFGAERAHLVGSSLGACIALQAALEYPQRVASLTSVAGFSELDCSLELNFRLRIGIIEKLGLGDALAAHIAMWTLGRDYINTAEGAAAVERLFAAVRRNSPERYLAFIRAILEFGRVEGEKRGQPPLTARLGEIRIPTCVVVGEQDILTPVRQSRQIADHIAGAEFHVIPRCGHITFTERPEETSAIIGDFLARANGA